MNKAELTEELTKIFRAVEGNVICEGSALDGCEGLVLFEEPLFGISDAEDSIYKDYKRREVIGETFVSPKEWMPEARSVISFFLPFTERVRASNRNGTSSTSSEWLHARIEGQAFMERFLVELRDYFERKGVKACVPSLEERFAINRSLLSEDDPEGMHFECSWSERHVAYASGLGTFSLSRGLITPKGSAGRCGSIIVSLEIPPDQRIYSGITDYCIMCGQCIKRCPVGAIDLINGKNQKLCSGWIDKTKEMYAPRYGCGKCQTDVPCESRIPLR